MKKNNFLTGLVITLLVSLLILTGCGGGGGTAGGDKDMADKGTINLTVNWPRDDRVIPPATNKLDIKLSGTNIPSIDMTVLRPSSGTPVTQTVHVPAGSNRLLAAKALDLNGKVLAVGGTLFSIRQGEVQSVGIDLFGIPPTPDPLGNQDYILSGNLSPDPNNPSLIWITLSAIIESGSGQPVIGLDESNFVVIEDGVVRRPVTVSTMAGTLAKTDVVFILDTTGSMWGALQGVTDSVQAFADYLVAQGLDVRYGAVTFGDAVNITQGEAEALPLPYEEAARPTFPLNSDVDAFKDFLSGLFPAVGGDTPENDLDAVVWAANNMSFRPDALKVFVLITDAPMHEAGDGMPFTTHVTSEVVDGVAGRIVVHVVGPPTWWLGRHVSNEGEVINDRFSRQGDSTDPKSLSEGTGGVWAELPWDGVIDLSELPIGTTIANGYLISYSSGALGQDHTVRLVVNVPGGNCADRVFNLHY